MALTSAGQERLSALAAEGARGDGYSLAESGFAHELSRLESGPGAAKRVEAIKSVLAVLVEQNRPLIAQQPYPAAVLDDLHQEFDRILRSLESHSDEHFDIARHPLRCDLRLLCFSRIPVGISQMEIDAVPRRYLFSNGLRQGLDFARLMLTTGGWSDYFVTHLRHYGITPLNFFMVNSADNRDAMYLIIADCLAMHPEIRGYYSASWWLDPALDQFSPHLEHIRRRILDNGGTLLRYGETEDAARDALANSPARQKLHREGRYQPVSYAFLWPRASMLAWARRFRSETMEWLQ